MTSDRTLAAVTADIVAGSLEGNHVTVDELPDLIRTVSRTVAGLGELAQSEPEPVERPSPGRIRRSIQGDVLISFEDGKPYKHLKRHLGALGLSADQYRAKWGLPADYPMVSPDYSARRSAVAKSYGFGRKVKGPQAPAELAPEPVALTSAGPAKLRIKGRLGLFGKSKSAT